MTNEEAREELKEELEILKSGIDPADWENPNEELTKIIEANTMAIEALEQQSCEDCISREAAIGIVAHIKEMHIDDREQYQINYGTICDIDLALQQLPSVQPQPKIGHWITTRTFMHDGEYYCDRCKCDAPNNEKWVYCPNCGADMRESEE